MLIEHLVKTPAFRAEMEAVFFEAMNAGYVAGSQKSANPLLLGKSVEFADGPWLVTDTWFTTPLGSRSGGLTAIFYGKTAVWMMQYLGQYVDEAIPCLKAALRAAYAEKKFFGGRGPSEFRLGEFIYRNEVDSRYQADFQQANFFKCYEAIKKIVPGKPMQSMGFHSCQGMMMV